MNLSALFSSLQRLRLQLAADADRKHDISRSSLRALVMAAMLVAALAPDMAMAAPWDQAGTYVLSILNNGLTRTIAIIAVVALGLTALAGKLSWNWAINIVLGIVLIFGAATIVDAIISAAQS